MRELQPPSSPLSRRVGPGSRAAASSSGTPSLPSRLSPGWVSLVERTPRNREMLRLVGIHPRYSCYSLCCVDKFPTQKVVDRLKTDGQQAYQASDYRRALYCLEKALEISTHSLLLKTSRAECLAFLGRYTEVDVTIQYKISTYRYLRSSALLCILTQPVPGI